MGLILTAGCYTGAPAQETDGEPTAGTDGGPGGVTEGGSNSDTTPTSGDEPTAGTSDTGGTEIPELPESSRVPRLSHRQWENSIRDLLLLEQTTGKSALFIGDPISGGYDNNSEKLVVSATLWTDYQRAAEEIAEQVIADPELVALLVPADGDSDARGRGFIESFGPRAYRRPLTPEEIDRHMQVFQEGVALGGSDPVLEGVRVVLQTFLQSPYFLYRVETSDVADDDGHIQLNGYEVASKLSYMLWDTMPDEELFEAAKTGGLDTVAGVEAQAARMLDHQRAHDMVASFHYQTLKVDSYSKITKSADKFPEFAESMRDMMRAETMMFVDDVVFEHEVGDLATLLSAPYSFVNATLAPLYGAQGQFTDQLVKTDLDPSQRAGVLTQLGYLAANASSTQNDPIHRGVFLNLQILCTGLPPPPNNVPPPPPAMEGESLRELIDRHTGIGTCGEACHGYLINPLGFAMEQYDPLGRWQTMDAGKPVDATGDFNFVQGKQSFNGGAELAKIIASSDEAHRCYVSHLLEYGYARVPKLQDNAEIKRLAEGSRDGLYSIKELIVELTTSDAFRFRAPVEE
ncbi:DUF1592 domain-containing protein [Nannocystis sp. SCPEA4]|uniref:DUF1592 domain-containing protein n=1 Tax=Nannocystis sp. SCPEA4 TaxID=2996787 RepID=UPI00226DEA2A|nr:DUF1592 domain-containing protein [Nannocystis sp. SCPEA4]MCY1060820.1 DUF1592 domain-containing protein [Nannocystis sp. SCPEA4]